MKRHPFFLAAAVLFGLTLCLSGCGGVFQTSTPTTTATASVTPSPTATATASATPSPTSTDTPVPTITPTPSPYDGEWQGSTSQGQEVSLTVQYAVVKAISVGIRCTGMSMTVSPKDISALVASISGGAFSFELPLVRVSGRFSGTNSVSGRLVTTAVGDLCPAETISWSATRK